ncbi:MAG: metal ABC transporter permease [Thermoanaerobaculales bacterium]|nr:metal ABC transporter permease [Thermoanaerobaculales bacterium]
MNPELEILLIAVVTAVACALVGVFLVLRRLALVSDAIAHAILPGIVVAFFLTGSLTSPLLVVAAAVTGVLSVALIEALHRTRLVAEDAATGLVFPAFFSLGVIMVSRWAGNVHLDTDSVLLGELAFAPFDRWIVAGKDLGPSALWMMSGILVLNLVLILVAAKELKLATLDPALATLLGFSPVLLHYLLMTAVSITAVGAFNAAGSILVVALMIAPPAAAFLLVERVAPMIWLSAVLAVLGAIGGYGLARWLDVSIAGSMAVMSGIIFAASFLLAPERGLLSQARRRASQKLEFSVRMLAVHLLHHEGTEREKEECGLDSLSRHLGWSDGVLRQAVGHTVHKALAFVESGVLHLTEEGRLFAEDLSVGVD